MIYRRLYDTSPHLFKPGEYGKWEGEFYLRSPKGLLANLGNHTIVEHDDFSITVRPSILVSDRVDSDHGYFTRGEWTYDPPAELL